MRQADVFVNGVPAGILREMERGKSYSFIYFSDYQGLPVSLTMPVRGKEYVFEKFPPFFEGVLPEGMLLEGLLRLRKIDKQDCFSQLMAVGNDLVGAVTVQEIGP